MGECEQARKQARNRHPQSISSHRDWTSFFSPRTMSTRSCRWPRRPRCRRRVVVGKRGRGRGCRRGEIERRNRVLSFFDSVHSLTHSLALPDLCRPCVDVPNCGCAQITPSFRHPVNQQTPLAPLISQTTIFSTIQQSMSTAHIH